LAGTRAETMDSGLSAVSSWDVGRHNLCWHDPSPFLELGNL
jgi:hypothetical protein